MFVIRREHILAGVLGATVAFSCSSDPSPEQPSGGDAGAGAFGGEDEAGASNSAGSSGASGSSAGAGASSSGGSLGGAGTVEGSAGLGGAEPGNEQGGGPDEGEVPFTLVPPSADCDAAAAVTPLPLTPAAGLHLAATSGQQCDATVEPNDVAGQACRLALGAKVETQLAAPADKTDNFVFHAEAGVSYTLFVSALACTGLPGGNYLSVSAKSLASAGETPQLSATVYFGERKAYEIRSNTTADELVTLATTQGCQYSVQVVQSTAQGLEHDSVYEPNDTASIAAKIEVGERIASSLTAPSDAADYFTFPVQGNLTYSVHVSAEHCSGTPGSNWVTVKGWSLGAGAAVENFGSTQAFFGGVIDKELVTATSGEQLLQIETSQSCEYELYVVPSTVCGLSAGSGYEPNNTPSTAAEISVGETISGAIRLPWDAVDYYSFSVEPKTKYALTLSAVDCVGNNTLSTLSANLWSGRTEELPSGSTLFSFGEEAKSFTFTSGSASTQLLRIAKSEACSYELSVSKK